VIWMALDFIRYEKLFLAKRTLSIKNEGKVN